MHVCHINRRLGVTDRGERKRERERERERERGRERENKKKKECKLETIQEKNHSINIQEVIQFQETFK